MKFQPRAKLGFTLIELLIVVAVISIIATIVAIVMPAQLKRARDAQRKTDLSNVQKALALYYNDNGFYPCGPLLSSLPVDKPVQIALRDIDDTCSSPTNPAFKPYMNDSIPEDPRAGSPNCYDPSFYPLYYYEVTDNGDKYTLYAKLENDTGQIELSVTCLSGKDIKYNYKVESP